MSIPVLILSFGIFTILSKLFFPLIIIVMLILLSSTSFRSAKISKQYYNLSDILKSIFNNDNIYSSGFNQYQKDHKYEETTNSNNMTLDEAREILGVQRNTTKEEIQKSYFALMKQVHPDKGGSIYLAQKVNKARDTLLKMYK